MVPRGFKKENLTEKSDTRVVVNKIKRRVYGILARIYIIIMMYQYPIHYNVPGNISSRTRVDGILAPVRDPFSVV